MSRIRVFLVHDYELARRGLRRMLEEYDDIEVVAEASNALEALSQIELVSPDVILMDAEMPHVSGLETMRILRERGLPGAVIVLSLDAQKLTDAVQLGARAYLVGEAEADELASVIRQVPEGGFVFGASLMSSTEGREAALRYLSEQQSRPTQEAQESTIAIGTDPERSIPSGEVEVLEEAELGTERPRVKADGAISLNRRERRILDLLAIGASDSLIAHILSTGEISIESYLTKLQRKLGLSSRSQMMDYAKRTVSAQGTGEKATARIAGAIPDEQHTELDSTTKEDSVPEKSIDGMESQRSPSAEASGVPIGDLELVFAPPLEPLKLIRVTQWLKEVGDAVIGETKGSWGEETVLKVTLRRPVPISQMATDISDVAEVTDEPFVGETKDIYKDLERLGGRLGAGFSLPKRFRVTFKAD